MQRAAARVTTRWCAPLVVAAAIAAGAVAAHGPVTAAPPTPRSSTTARSTVPQRIGRVRPHTGSRAESLLTDFLVRTSDAAAQRRVMAWAAAHRVVAPNRFDPALRVAALTMPSGSVAAVRAIPGVVAVEPDRPVRLAGAEGSAPWGLDRIDQRSASLDATYHYSATGAGVTAYVVDTGLRVSHADFVGRVGAGGFVDFNDNTGVEDCKGHGTHTAGTLGGTVYGVAKGVTIVPVKVLDCTGTGSDQTVIAGLNWVFNDHQPGTPAVVNLSLGGPASVFVDSAVQALVDAGVTVVVAAGNEHDLACNSSPARVPGAITVGAVDQHDVEAPFSNYGTCVDVFAPGVDITSDWYTSDTAAAVASGTSMATPHVAGAAALILQLHPTYTPAQVWAAMKVTAAGSRRISFQPWDVGSPNSLLYTGPIAVPSAPAAPSTVPGNTSITVSWTPPTFDGNMPVTGYRVQRTSDGVHWVTVTTASASTRRLVVGGLGNGVPYRFRVAAVNHVGASLDSASSAALAPRTRPGAVGTVRAQPLNGAALLTWTAPASDGGAAVRNYRIERSTNGITWTSVTLAAPLTRTFTVGGLTNGTAYRFRVAAANIAGPGTWSVPVAVVPAPVASAPGRPATVATDRAIRLTWAAPVSPGGSPVSAYRVLKSVDGITWLVVTAAAPLSRTFTVSGLTNGVQYRFRVAAVNRSGIGAWSASATATPHV